MNVFARWPKVMLGIALVAALVFQFSSSRINGYALELAINVGINIILAVSLNLINGYTGQFSLGHAGFMAVGAYASAAVSMFLAPKIFGTVPQTGAIPILVFVVALLLGGLAAAVAGIIVGAPSLRLKGDYLAHRHTGVRRNHSRHRSAT